MLTEKLPLLIVCIKLIICTFFAVSGLECYKDEFECSDGSYCLSRYDFCDGYRSCRDGSDEIRYTWNITRKVVACRHDRYICVLPEDEKAKRRVLCRKSLTCNNDEFSCSDGSGCLPWHFFCNGHAECLDGSDEIRRVYHSTEGIPCRNGGYICVLPESQIPKEDVLCRENSLECKIDEFECSDGSGCLPSYEFCNGFADCSDGSDEIPSQSQLAQNGIECRRDRRICFLPESLLLSRRFFCKKTSECENHEFTCADGSGCLPAHDFCDGIAHCRDKSDEIQPSSQSGPRIILCRQDKYVCVLPESQVSKKDLFCRKNPECEINEFLCRDGSRCLSANEFCDGEAYCQDNSDAVRIELNSNFTGIPCRYDSYICLLPEDQAWKREHLCIKSTECNEDEFACSDASQCIPNDNFCNGLENCIDGSDEIPATLKSQSIDMACIRGSHECLLPKRHASKKDILCKVQSKMQNRECKENEFKCADGSQCLSASLFCDGIEDCRDGSDEVKFSFKSITAVNEIPCRREQHICLLPKFQESKKSLFCKKRPKCNKNEFTCEEGTRCLPSNVFCNGRAECSDGSDDIRPVLILSRKGVTCLSGNYTCFLPQRQVWKKTSLCDDIKCDRNEFTCSDGSWCIPRRNFCDGIKHCRDGSDEAHQKFQPIVRGILCRRGHKVCILPRQQASKKKILCGNRAV